MATIEDILNRVDVYTNYDGKECIEVATESYLETDLLGRANCEALIFTVPFFKTVHDGKWHRSVGVFVQDLPYLSEDQLEELEDWLIFMECDGVVDDTLYCEYREAELVDFVYNEMWQSLDWFPDSELYSVHDWIDSLSFDDIRDHIMFEGDRPYVLDTIKELYDETAMSV